MDNDKKWEDTVRGIQEETNNSYTTEHIKQLIGHTLELFTLMRRVGYSDDEIWELFFDKKRLGEKEQALKDALLSGKVLPTDSLATIRKKMMPVMDRSRQSWGIAFQRLIDDGILG